MKVWSRDYDAQYLLRVNCFRRFEYSTIWTVPDRRFEIRKFKNFQGKKTETQKRLILVSVQMVVLKFELDNINYFLILFRKVSLNI